jgi:carbonic anhydrase
VLRSLVVSQRLLGTHEIMVVMHTDCGMQVCTMPTWPAASRPRRQVEVPFAFSGFGDLDTELRASVERLRSCPWLPNRDLRPGLRLRRRDRRSCDEQATPTSPY